MTAGPTHRFFGGTLLVLVHAILCALQLLPVAAFVSSTRQQHSSSFVAATANAKNRNIHRSSIHLQATAKNITEAATVADVQDNIASILSQADPSVDAPLPPAYTKCPFTGVLQGPQSFYRMASKELQSPSIFSFVHKNNQPMVQVSGGANVRKLLSQEFSHLSSNAVAAISQIVCGTHSLRTVQDKAEHRALRDLIGVPLAAKAVEASIPRLEAICRQRIQEMVLNKSESDDAVVKTFDVTQAMALDVTWQQVLGLDLKTKEEIDTFHSNASIWLRGIYNKPGSPEMEATLKVREYLVQMIEEKIDQLMQAGESDGSTVGGLVYATLEDAENVSTRDHEASTYNNNQRTLSRNEVIDNALLLILASTEITSSVMANALLLMGLHPDVWQNVVNEQKAVVKNHGESFSRDVLEHDIPYLEVVVKETLRILPVTLVSKRATIDTIVLDGYQIPKGWGVSYDIFLSHQQKVNGGIDVEGKSSSGMDLSKDFQPSQWLKPETQPRMADYIPFGAGPRKCPGVILAMTEIEIFLSIFARSVQNYDLVMNIDKDKPIDEQIMWKQLNAVPIPEDGVKIRVFG